MKKITIFLSVFFFFIIADKALALTSLNGRTDDGIDKEQAAVKKFDLSRFQDQTVIRRAIKQRLLTRVPARGRGFYLDRKIGVHASGNRHLYRYARPYTRQFIFWLGRQYQRRFHGSFKVTSLVRSCSYQLRLSRSNTNAVTCEATSHTTGATVDIAKRGMSSVGQKWMRKTLLNLERRGLIQATEERRQPVFHVMVYPLFSRRYR